MNSTFILHRNCNTLFAEALLPNTIVILFFMLLGIMGNSLVLYFYRYKMPQTEERFLIPYLAIADFFSCVTLAALGIVINYYYIHFPSEILCQLLHYFSWVTTFWSALILLLISIGRYRKICRPLRSKMPLHRQQCAVFLCLVFSILNTLPVVYFAGLRHQDVVCSDKNTTVAMCELRDFEGVMETVKDWWVAFEFFLTFTNIGITGGLYFPIGLKIFRRFQLKKESRMNAYRLPEGTDQMGENNGTQQKRKTKNRRNTAIFVKKTDNVQDLNMSKLSVISLSYKKQNNPEGLEEKSERGCHDKRACDVNTESEQPVEHSDVIISPNCAKTERNKQVRNNFTYMFITIIVFYVLSYLPTFVTIILATGDPFHFWNSMDPVTMNVVMLMRRSSIINHIVNPFIYGYFDVAFRDAFIASVKTCSTRE